MRRAAAAASAAALLITLASPAAAKGNPRTPIAPVSGNDVQHSLTVEQQTDWPWPEDPADRVLNPFPDCSWDVDDRWSQGAVGYLGPGLSYEVTDCLVSEPNGVVRTVNGVTQVYASGHLYHGSLVRAPSPALVVQVCWQPQGKCVVPLPGWNAAASAYDYATCARAVYGSEMTDVVPGSNGGIGVRTDVTVTLTNTSGSGLRDVQVGTAVGLDRPSGCATVPVTMSDYPFQWGASGV